MKASSLRLGLAALTVLGGLAAAAHAQLPPVPAPGAPAAPTAPQVVTWPGGYMVLNSSGGMVVRNSAPGTGSTNVITNSGNGFGNRIVVDGGSGGTTIVKNVRNGIGNELILNPDDLFLDLDALLGAKPCPKRAVPVAPAPVAIPPAADPNPPAPVPAVEPAPALPAPADGNAAPAPPSYKGKASPFWTKKAFSEAYDCNLYWCPTTKLWFRYTGEDDTYQPVPTQPAAPQ